MATTTQNTPAATAADLEQLEGHLEQALLAWGMTPGSPQMESMLKMITDDARWLLLQHETLRP